ncbi:CBS domain-containing protein [Nodosilinea sp. AN01ver1]|uniref:CBS domain-containing protein n=1 Tax=Nodosilinea sp. AN01ver1 TaxID=3423362 RepID=UPI003D31425B
MGKTTPDKDTKALLFAAIFLVISILVIAILKYILVNVDGATVIAFLLAPIIIYALVSERLSEFTGPGGWGAKFLKEATEIVDPSQTEIGLSMLLMEVIPKGLPQDLRERISRIRDGRPIVMTMTLGREGFYQVGAVRQVIEALSQFRNFKFVIFLNKDNQFVGFMPSWALNAMLKSDRGDAKNFIEDINNGCFDRVKERLGVITELVYKNETNAQALEKMERLNLEALVVLDEQTNEVIGVVERDRLLSRMMLALANSLKH